MATVPSISGRTMTTTGSPLSTDDDLDAIEYLEARQKVAAAIDMLEQEMMHSEREASQAAVAIASGPGPTDYEKIVEPFKKVYEVEQKLKTLKALRHQLDLQLTVMADKYADPAWLKNVIDPLAKLSAEKEKEQEYFTKLLGDISSKLQKRIDVQSVILTKFLTALSKSGGSTTP